MQECQIHKDQVKRKDRIVKYYLIIYCRNQLSIMLHSEKKYNCNNFLLCNIYYIYTPLYSDLPALVFSIGQPNKFMLNFNNYICIII